MRILVYVAASLTVGFALGCTNREARIVNRTVVEVNGQSINAKVFAERLARELRNRDPLTVKDPQLLEKAKADLVDSLIIELITHQWAEKNKIDVSTEEIEQTVKKTRSEYTDELAFRKQLAEENIAIDVWKADLKRSLLQKKVFEKVTSSSTALGASNEPTDQEARARYEANKKDFLRPARIRLRQVVLEKEEDGKRVAEEVLKGRDIGALAKQFSIMPEASQNGDTGWIEKGTLEVFDQAFKINVGAKSRLIKSPYGWHIYEVLAKEPEKRISFDQAKVSIMRELKEHRTQAVFARWLEGQIRSSTVKRDEAILKAISLSTRIE